MALFSDDFEDESIDVGWTQVVGASPGAFAEERGYLKITSGGGGVYGSWTPTWIYQAGISGDFDVVIRALVDYDTFDDTYEQFGLIAAVDTENHIHAQFVALGANYNQYRMARQDVVSDTPNEGTSVTPYQDNVFLRIKRVSSTFTVYYSLNGTSWTVLAAPGTPLSSSDDVDIGIYAHHYGGVQYYARIMEFTKYSDFSFPSESPQEDSFGDASIDEIWLREGQDGGGVTEASGVLSITSSANNVDYSAYGPYGLYQFVDGDFDVCVKALDFSDVNHNYEQFGFIAELDRANTVEVCVEYNNALNMVGKSIVSNTMYRAEGGAYSESTVYLRIKRVSSTLTLYYSEDKLEWTQLSPSTILSSSAKLKLMLFASHIFGSQYTVYFDDFENYSSGWTGKICGVDSADISKICGIAIADIEGV